MLVAALLGSPFLHRVMTPGFVPGAAADVGHGPVTTVFLCLILFVVVLNSITLCFSVPYWLSANEVVCMRVWPGWGTTITSGWESTCGLCALKQKYHLLS